MTKRKREIVGQHDPSANALLEIGLYPANIISVNIREGVDTKIGTATVYNLNYKLAEAVGKMQQPLYKSASNGNFEYDDEGERIIVQDDKGENTMISCAFAVGRELKFHSVWCFNEDKGKGANTRYAELMKIAEVEAESIEVQPGISVKQLVKLEEEDLLGKPVLVRIDYKPSPTKETKDLPKEQQEFRYWSRVIEIMKWGSGKAIDPKELAKDDLPF
ncbi:MAG: hypothetical protein H8E98_05730 [Bacteroidetes bacterium]|nr:hypothetical protein [Bacteroidota bacterium]